MRFGQRIKAVSERTAVREHQHAYVPYRALKKLIRQAPTEEVFWAQLAKSIAVLNQHVSGHVAQLETRVRALVAGDAPYSAIAELSTACGNVLGFIWINREALRKIAKKYDKQVHRVPSPAPPLLGLSTSFVDHDATFQQRAASFAASPPTLSPSLAASPPAISPIASFTKRGQAEPELPTLPKPPPDSKEGSNGQRR